MVNNILVTNTTAPIYTDHWPSMILSGKNNIFNGGLQENMFDLGGNLINTDPLLDLMHRPLSGSPVINTGADTITSVTDLDRMPRVIDKQIDLGAFEFPTGNKDTVQLYFVQGSAIHFNS
jgi:hypothetical protein